MLLLLFIFVSIINLITCQQQHVVNEDASSICQSGIREDNTNYIYCARRNLQDIPQLLNKNIVYDELVLTDNRIQKLDENSFEHIKVKKLYLNGNPISYINNKTFQYVANYLDELWLDSDPLEPLEQIPYAIKYYLRNLNQLYLKNFNLKILNNNSFEKLQRLEILSLDSCSIEFIETNAFNGLKNTLRELYLKGNKLTHIPINALNNMKSLRVLSLSQNFIKYLNFASFKLSDSSCLYLHKLDLSYNGIKQIERNSYKCLGNSLITLNMQNNEINSFNIEFLMDLHELKELNFDFNIITKLKRGLFENSNKLEVLSLQGNNIQFDDNDENEVDEASYLNFNGLFNLFELNLARNNIKKLPINLFSSMRNLKSLNLDRNFIENFDLNTFNGLKMSLINISMQNVKLKNLDCLNGFMKLERVKLGFNQIEILNWSLVLDMSRSLTYLDIQANQIKFIDFKRDHMRNSNLNELDLSNNRLCTFDEIILDTMKNLKFLSLTQNPLFCDCNLLYLHEWTKRTYNTDIIQFIQWKCDGSNFLNKNFFTLTSNDFKCDQKARYKSKCENFVSTTTTTPTTKTVTTTTIPRHTTLKLMTERVTNNVQLDFVLNDFFISNLNSNLYLKWSIDKMSVYMGGFRINIDEIVLNENKDYYTKVFTILNLNQREFLITNLKLNKTYTICLSAIMGFNKYCREYKIIENEFLNANQNVSVPLTTYRTLTLLNTFNVNSTILTIIFSISICVLILLILFILTFLYKCKKSKFLFNSQNETHTIPNTSTLSSILSSLNKNDNNTPTSSGSTTSTTNTQHNQMQSTIVYPCLQYDYFYNGSQFFNLNELDQHVYCEIPTYYHQQFQNNKSLLAKTSNNNSECYYNHFNNKLIVNSSNSTLIPDMK